VALLRGVRYEQLIPLREEHVLTEQAAVQLAERALGVRVVVGQGEHEGKHLGWVIEAVADGCMVRVVCDLEEELPDGLELGINGTVTREQPMESMVSLITDVHEVRSLHAVRL
jgi:hypothetical protein